MTYGFAPRAYTTSSLYEPLQNAIIFCPVESWLTGRRLVSLPFSDHCEPLLDTEEDATVLANALRWELTRKQWRYIEMRPLQSSLLRVGVPYTSIKFSFHELDLSPDLGAIYRNFHKSSIQRKIRRADREGLTYGEGSSDVLLDQFYSLFKKTRKRHRLPAQSREWFSNLRECFGDSLRIRIAYQGERPVASILTIRHKDAMTYKYGASDSRFNNLGGMHFLFWITIQEAKAAGMRTIDFGRTDDGQQGLITFKNRWGATESQLTYLRYGDSGVTQRFYDVSAATWRNKAAKFVFSHLPMPLLSLTGRFLYRHIG
jgi:predicted N-acyltransferase